MGAGAEGSVFTGAVVSRTTAEITLIIFIKKTKGVLFMFEIRIRLDVNSEENNGSVL